MLITVLSNGTYNNGQSPHTKKKHIWGEHHGMTQVINVSWQRTDSLHEGQVVHVTKMEYGHPSYNAVKHPQNGKKIQHGT